jgi:isopentenyl-diphosphate delta-isomerase
MVAFYASTPAYRGVLALYGWEQVGEELSGLARERRWDEMAKHVSDEMLREFSVTGRPSEVAQEIVRRYRALAAGDLDKASLAEVFREWGIPTAAAVMEVSRVEGVEVVGSGGIRTGLEVAKVLALGASMAGMARPFLSAAVEGPEAVMRLASKIERELRAAMVLTGSRRIADLRSAPRVILGPLKDWCEQRGVLR